MRKENKDKKMIKKPFYDGGKKAMDAFIRENLKYPKAALKEKIEGSVYVRFELNHQGKVVRAKNVSSLGYGCDEEAIRVVKLLKYVVPKNPHRLKLKFNKKIQIHFKLKKTKKLIPAKTSYKMIMTKKKENPTDKAPSYGYTIQW